MTSAIPLKIMAATDVDALVRKLTGEVDAALVQKAKELVRLADVRCQTMPQQERICRPMVCIDIACGILGRKIDRTELLKASAVTKKVYNATLQRLRAVLVDADSRKDLSFRTIAVRFDCMEVVPTCETVLEVIKKTTSEIESTSPVYIVAIFYICCKYFKVRTNKEVLIEEAMVPPSRFQQIYDLIAVLAKNELKAAIQDFTPKKRKAAEIEDSEPSPPKTSSTALKPLVMPTPPPPRQNRVLAALGGLPPQPAVIPQPPQPQRQRRLIVEEEEQEDEEQEEEQEPQPVIDNTPKKTQANQSSAKDEFEEWRQTLLQEIKQQLVQQEEQEEDEEEQED